MSGDLADRLAAHAAAATELDAGGAEIPAALLVEALLRGDTAQRALKVKGARLTGRLDLENAEVRCALSLTDCEVADGVVLDEARTRAVRLTGCRIGGGLSARHLMTAGDLDLTGSTISGGLALQDAHIGGALSLIRATLRPGSEWALSADGLRVDANLDGTGLKAFGALQLMGARVGGQLDLCGANVEGDEYALLADSIDVALAVVLSDGFTARGCVRLVGARIGAQLEFGDAILSAPGGTAFDGVDMRVARGIVSRAFTATGEVALHAAQVGGTVDFVGAELDALSAEGLVVQGDVLCQNGFRARGDVAFHGARITGQLGFVGATLAGGVNLQEARAGSLWLLFETPPAGAIDIRAATFATIVDAPPPAGASWPRYWLRGCTYDAFEPQSPVSVDERLAWLAGDPAGYSPQPYEQLAAVYRRAGNEDDARRVLIRKQRRQRDILGPRARLWSWFLEVTVGYGYRPSLALGWLLGLLAIGALLFGVVLDDRLTPAHAAREIPDFQPVIYTLDVLVPVINLGQRVAWIPHGAAQWLSFALTVTGWLLTTALVGGIAARRQ